MMPAFKPVTRQSITQPADMRTGCNTRTTPNRFNKKLATGLLTGLLASLAFSPLALGETMTVTEDGREYILDGYYDKDGDFIIESVRPANPEPVTANPAPRPQNVYEELILESITEGTRPDQDSIRSVNEQGEEVRTFSIENEATTLSIDNYEETLVETLADSGTDSDSDDVVITEARPVVQPEFDLPDTLSIEELSDMTPKAALKELDREMQILTSRVLTINRDLVLMTENRYFPTPKHHEFLDAGKLLADIKQGKTIEYQTEANARLADLYLAYGMHSDASVIYHNLENQDQGRMISDDAWLNLGRTQLKRGYFGLTGNVEYALSHISRRAPRQIRAERDILLGQLYIEQKRYNDAERILDDWRGADDLEPFVEYNQAIALIRAGEVEEGVGLLDDVGTLRETTPMLLALRDRANLSLGQHFIKEKQGATAVPILQRVRVDGPYSNAALLSLGWASVTDYGKRNVNLNRIPKECLEQDPRNNTSGAPAGLLISGAENPACDVRPSFARSSDLDDEELGPMLNALTPWLVLVDRKLTDPAVHEGLLAVPYAFEKMGKPQYAAKYYNEAIAKFQKEKFNIAETLQLVNDGTMLRALLLREPDRQLETDIVNASDTQGAAFSGWRTDDLSSQDGIDVDRLHGLLSSHVFRETLTNYRHLQVMRRNMNDWELLVGEFDARLRAAGIPYLGGVADNSLQINPDESLQNEAYGVINDNPYLQNAPDLGLSTELNIGDAAGIQDDENPLFQPDIDLTPQTTPSLASPRLKGGLAERVQGEQLRIAKTQVQISQAIYAHEQFLRRLASVTLLKRQERIDLYMQRARYSLAKMSDILQMTAPDDEDLPEDLPAVDPELPQVPLNNTDNLNNSVQPIDGNAAELPSLAPETNNI